MEVNRRLLEYRAEYDSLTGYYNYDKFKEMTMKLIVQNKDKNYVICYVDIKNFKFLNDIYGYEEGDRILKYWADTLNKISREGEIFARVSADHFVTLRTYKDEEDLNARFQNSTGELYLYQSRTNKKFPLEVTTGMYQIEKNDPLTIEEMIDRANLAGRSVKHLTGSQFAIYDDKMRNRIIIEKGIETEMLKAVREEQFEVYFQPFVDIQNNNKVAGAEALVRWVHPEKGIIPPIEFISLFEHNGFITKLDLYMFEKVCQYIKTYNPPESYIFAINVSRVSVYQSDFAEQYASIKDKYNIPDHILELECTETTVVENPAVLNEAMEKLRKHGFLFSIDDFGSGYSSLNVLKEIPTVNILKLDRIFFTNDLENPRNNAIVSSIISMAKLLNMKVVAEGVEEKHQCEMLKEMNCDYIQGYYFSRPIPLEEFNERYNTDI